MEGTFDTGPYLNVIECFVAEGSLLIFTCAPKNSQRWKTPAEGARESRGCGLGGRRRLLAGERGGFMSSLGAPLSSPPFFFFPLLPFWTFFSQRKGTPSPLSDRRLAGWGGDETALNEKRLRVEKGAEPERNIARRRGADDSGGIQRIHSWPARCYV